MLISFLFWSFAFRAFEFVSARPGAPGCYMTKVIAELNQCILQNESLVIHVWARDFEFPHSYLNRKSFQEPTSRGNLKPPALRKETHLGKIVVIEEVLKKRLKNG